MLLNYNFFHPFCVHICPYWLCGPMDDGDKSGRSWSWSHTPNHCLADLCNHSPLWFL